MRKLNLRSVLGRKSAIVVAGGAAVLAVSATAAFAYWSTTGSGSGSATAGNTQTVSVVQVGTTSGLTPGGSAKSIDFKITNPASSKQYISSVTIAIPVDWNSSADATKPACTAKDFTVTPSVTVNADLAIGDTPFTGLATIAMNDSAANQDNCKGVQVPLIFSAS